MRRAIEIASTKIVDSKHASVNGARRPLKDLRRIVATLVDMLNDYDREIPGYLIYDQFRDLERFPSLHNVQ